jgi:hypothetical protein
VLWLFSTKVAFLSPLFRHIKVLRQPVDLLVARAHQEWAGWDVEHFWFERLVFILH